MPHITTNTTSPQHYVGAITSIMLLLHHACRDPIILPYFHSGMSRVMPFKSMIPRIGQEVVVAVGQPLDLGHITCRCNQPGAHCTRLQAGGIPRSCAHKPRS